MRPLKVNVLSSDIYKITEDRVINFMCLKIDALPLKGLIKSKISILQNLIYLYFIILPVLAHIKIIYLGGGGTWP